MQPDVYLFLYDFPHRKGEDILLECVLQGLKPAGVIAAPKKKLTNGGDAPVFRPLPFLSAHEPSRICANFDIPYHVIPHEDAGAIKEILTSDAIGIIGGARIIPAKVIELFRFGVINYHPGPIPETSGLDSFFWMIEKNANPGITTHYIDGRVDAGRLIEKLPVSVHLEDTAATINYKLYLTQLESHRKIVNSLRNAKVPESTPIDRPAKNQPMSRHQKLEVISRLDIWLRSWS